MKLQIEKQTHRQRVRLLANEIKVGGRGKIRQKEATVGAVTNINCQMSCTTLGLQQCAVPRWWGGSNEVLWGGWAEAGSILGAFPMPGCLSYPWSNEQFVSSIGLMQWHAESQPAPAWRRAEMPPLWGTLSLGITIDWHNLIFGGLGSTQAIYLARRIQEHWTVRLFLFWQSCLFRARRKWLTLWTAELCPKRGSLNRYGWKGWGTTEISLSHDSVGWVGWRQRSPHQSWAVARSAK